MFSPSYTRKTGRFLFGMPMSAVVKTPTGTKPVHFGDLFIKGTGTAKRFSIESVTFRGIDVRPLLAFLEYANQIPLHQSIIDAVTNHLSGDDNDMEDDHTMNLQNDYDALPSIPDQH